MVEANLDDLKVDCFAKQKKNLAKDQGISIVVRGKEGKESGAKSKREQPVYNLSSKKLWSSSNTKLEWEIEQQTPSNLDLECSISFYHPHLTIADHWEKLKCIEKTLQPIDFQMFTVVEKRYINEKLKHSFLRMWR
jgi:hypothetical protein